MIVSILQMMGFPKGKPDKVRAEESNAAKLKKAAANPPTVTRAAPAAPKVVPEKKQAAASVKPKDKVPKDKVPKDTKIKTKDSKKDAAQTLAIKEAVNKDKPKSKDKQPVAKPVAKEVKAEKAPPTIKESPPVAPATKPVKAAKPAPAKAAATQVKVVVAAVQAAVAPAKKAAAKAVAAAVKPMAAALPALAAAAKAARPSSRLAQITVPSMAQTIASTAAKSSYSQTPPSPAMAPVIPAIVKKDTKLANNWKSKPVAQLTDAELLAMPDAEYMNEVQLAAFRLKLCELKSGILSNAGETTEHLREESSVVPDPADRATIEEEHALELRTRDRERKLLKKIEQSISRIDAGDYGYCDETGEPIGVGRLLARPTATLSLEAQQRRELKQKMFGD